MNDSLQKSILSSDEYAEIEKNGFVTPYIVEIHRSNKTLLFYGSEHTNNPAHAQFKDIKKRWKKFTVNTEKPIALVEGHFDEVSEKETEDEIKSIVAGGEAQFVVHLARADGVEVSSPEPEKVWEANELSKEFGREAVVFFYFVRQIAWWNGFTEKLDIQSEAKSMLALMKGLYKWEDVDFTLDRMTAVHEELFGKPVEWDNAQWIYDITTPATQEYVTNKLARRSGELRDSYILEQILKYWDNGRNMFLVFGSSHAIRLEPALRKL